VHSSAYQKLRQNHGPSLIISVVVLTDEQQLFFDRSDYRWVYKSGMLKNGVVASYIWSCYGMAFENRLMKQITTSAVRIRKVGQLANDAG
jgi:hypothetical protein